MTTLRCTITIGQRSFSEVLNYDIEYDGWEQWKDDWDDDYLRSRPVPTWEDFTRPVEVDEDGLELLSQLGGHILYGWVEYISQSDYSPMFSLTEFNDEDQITYSFERNDHD